MATNDFDLRQLEIFCKVAELKSFSKAAETVFLAQASVSERIANLEEIIGTKLFDRAGRQVEPTKAGELLYRHATRLLEMKKNVRLEMDNFLGLRKGSINIGGSTVPGEYILPKIIGSFHEKYPFLSIRLSISDTAEIERHVLKGDLELGVTGSRSPDKELVHYDLWKDELVLAVNAGHRWAKKKQIAIDELREENFILREDGSGTLNIIENSFKALGIDGIRNLRPAISLGSSTAVKEGIKAGVGISIISSRAIETEIQAGLLKTVKIKGLPPLLRSFYLITDRKRTPSPACKALLQFLKSSQI
jgi:DNA-binding transcriptional LysR family regulator